MEIGIGIESSWAKGFYGTLGLFLSGKFFGLTGVALLTNSHVISAELDQRAKLTWEKLNATWKTLHPNTPPGQLRKDLYTKLGSWLADFRAGTLAANPPMSRLDPNAPANKLIFSPTDGVQDIRVLYGEINDYGTKVVMADAIYQPQVGSDFAVALLRPGTAHENMTRSGATGSIKNVITTISASQLAPAPAAAPKGGSRTQAATSASAAAAKPATVNFTNKNVYKYGQKTGFTQGVVISQGMDRFNVRGANGLFSDHGDSGSAVFDDANAWLGLLYAGRDTAQGANTTMCYSGPNILAALNRYHEGVALAGSNGTA
jgi:hypothetical protein